MYDLQQIYHNIININDLRIFKNTFVELKEHNCDILNDFIKYAHEFYKITENFDIFKYICSYEFYNGILNYNSLDKAHKDGLYYNDERSIVKDVICYHKKNICKKLNHLFENGYEPVYYISFDNEYTNLELCLYNLDNAERYAYNSDEEYQRSINKHIKILSIFDKYIKYENFVNNDIYDFHINRLYKMFRCNNDYSHSLTLDE